MLTCVCGCNRTCRINPPPPGDPGHGACGRVRPSTPPPTHTFRGTFLMHRNRLIALSQTDPPPTGPFLPDASFLLLPKTFPKSQAPSPYPPDPTLKGGWGGLASPTTTTYLLTHMMMLHPPVCIWLSLLFPVIVRLVLSALCCAASPACVSSSLNHSLTHVVHPVYDATPPSPYTQVHVTPAARYACPGPSLT